MVTRLLMVLGVIVTTTIGWSCAKNDPATGGDSSRASMAMNQEAGITIATNHLRQANQLPRQYDVEAKSSKSGWTVIFWKTPRVPSSHVVVEVSEQGQAQILDPRRNG